VRLEGSQAGFALLRQGTYFPERDAAPGMLVAEFFVLRKCRHPGIGRQVARLLFDRYPGRWEVAELPQNTAGLAFWRQVIEEFTRGDYKEVTLYNERWYGPVQVFNNS
jgi:predicted acetyltransferase